MAFDLNELLNTPISALEKLASFSDIKAFLEFSEESIRSQRQAEWDSIDRQVDDEGVSDEERFQYRRHLSDSIAYRYDVALPMRVRYAALTALTSAVEWSVAVLRPSFKIPEVPQNLLSRTGISLERPSR